MQQDPNVEKILDGLQKPMWTTGCSRCPELEAKIKTLKEMLQAARDQLKYIANSDGGLVRRIDNALKENDLSTS